MAADRVVFHNFMPTTSWTGNLLLHKSILDKSIWVIWGIDMYNYKRPGKGFITGQRYAIDLRFVRKIIIVFRSTVGDNNAKLDKELFDSGIRLLDRHRVADNVLKDLFNSTKSIFASTTSRYDSIVPTATKLRIGDGNQEYVLNYVYNYHNN